MDRAWGWDYAGQSLDIVNVLVTFSCSCDKVCNKTSIRKEWLISSQFEGPVHHGREAWPWEHEAAGHIASTVREQRGMDPGAQLDFFPFIFRLRAKSIVGQLSHSG